MRSQTADRKYRRIELLEFRAGTKRTNEGVRATQSQLLKIFALRIEIER